MQKNLALSYVIANTLLASLSSLDTFLQSSDSMVFIFVSETSMSTSEQPYKAIVSAAVFLHTSKLPGSSNFKLCLYSSDIQTNSTKLAEASNLSNVPFKYHKFTNIFNKTKAEVFAPYWSYNLQINLEEGAQPPVGLIYSLSASPLCIVHQSYSLRKKMVHFTSMSHLYVNFCDLNYISKKDRYLLLLISNLLDLPHKA